MTKALPLPSSMEEETPTTKTVFLWLEPQGEVSHSVALRVFAYRDIGKALYITPPSVQVALTRLRELGLLEDLEPASGSAPGRYRVKRPKSRTSDREA